MQKNIYWLLLVGLMAASCGDAKKDQAGTLNDKKAKLEKLKTEQKNINQQIAALETEIAVQDPNAANTENAKLVSLTTIAPDSFAHYIELQGTVNAQNMAYVTPRGAGGQVKAIYVQQGQQVHKGQLLMKLDDATARTQVEQIQSQLSYAKDLYQRQQNLWKQDIGTEVQLLNAKNNVTNLEKQLQLANEQLSFSNVYAEMNGVADQVTIKVGEMFSPQTATMSGIRIVNNNDLKVVTNVPENYLGRVNVGSNIQVVIPEENNRTINAKVTVVGKVIDPNTRSFYIEARIPSNANLKPNQITKVRIKDYGNNNAITIPVNTLQNDENGKFVMVAVQEKGKMVARKRSITVGELYGDQLEVKSGLQPGDVLITDGFQGLYDGQPITTSAK